MTNGFVNGYLRTIKTTAVGAIQSAFQVIYPEDDASGGSQMPYVSIEYPIRQADYPGVWIDYEPAMLQTAGINYTELDSEGNFVARWRFQGHATFTVGALSSNERDEIYDQLIAMTAFAAQSDAPGPFRSYVEAQTLVATTWSYDAVEARGTYAAPGTPWGTDEVIYETGIALQVIGEFVTDPVTLQLVDLREIQVTMTDSDSGASRLATIDSSATGAAIPGS
jgi:hypothetical protein